MICRPFKEEEMSRALFQMYKFRPISLCTEIFKIVSKALANRLKRVLSEVISDVQSAYVLKRQIVDNIICAQEVIHTMNKNHKVNHLALKSDISKAYDRVEWNFLQAVMVCLGFDSTLVQLIIRCVQSISYAILINRTPTQSFMPYWDFSRVTLSCPIYFSCVMKAFWVL